MKKSAFPLDLKDADHTEGKGETFKLIAGAVVFAAGMVIDMFFAPELSRSVLLGVFIAAYLILGGNIILHALKNILRGQFFDKNFLMSLATIGVFIIGEYPEAVGVMLFYWVAHQEILSPMALGITENVTALL